MFRGDKSQYISIKNELKKLEISLTQTTSYKAKGKENDKDRTWILSLPAMQLWQKYRLADALKLTEENEEEVSVSLLKLADNSNHQIENTLVGITPKNILLGFPLKNANKQLAKTLALQQKDFWQRVFNNAKDNSDDKIKKEIFAVVHQYLIKTKKFSIRRSRVLKELYDLIVTTDDCDLFQELQNFLTDKHRFQTGALGRIALRKNILAIFSKPKKINCKKIDKLNDQEVRDFLKALPHDSHLSRKRYYNIGAKVIKFSHTIEVAEKDLENPDSEKNYFVHRAEKIVKGIGAFSIVKLLDFSFIFENSEIKIDKKPWVVKKYKKRNELDQANVRATRILERLNVNESETTKACSPNLESHRLFRGKNRFKLFMRNAGNALRNSDGKR